MTISDNTREPNTALRDRLVKILGMLGSEHAGERDAAGLAASRLLKQSGFSWDDVLTPARSGGGAVEWLDGFKAGQSNADVTLAAAKEAAFARGFMAGRDERTTSMPRDAWRPAEPPPPPPSPPPPPPEVDDLLQRDLKQRDREFVEALLRRQYTEPHRSMTAAESRRMARIWQRSKPPADQERREDPSPPQFRFAGRTAAAQRRIVGVLLRSEHDADDRAFLDGLYESLCLRPIEAVAWADGLRVSGIWERLATKMKRCPVGGRV